MTPKGYQNHREQLLKEKEQVDGELAALRNELKLVKRDFRTTGRAANRDWLMERENKLVELGRMSQQLQRQLGGLNAVKRREEPGLEHFVHQLLLERGLGRAEVEEIFAQAMIRRRLHLDDQG
jgi:hypothetical protein